MRIRFRLGEFKGHKFLDMRIFTCDDGKDPAPTEKGLAVSPALWSQVKKGPGLNRGGHDRGLLLDRDDLSA